MGNVLLITGASSGIGAATAKAAVKEGWKVALFARSEEPMRKLEKELGKDNVEVIVGDVTSFDSQKDAVEQTVKRWGHLNAAFANAGMGVDTPGTEEGDPSEWEMLVKVNVLGVLYTAKAALPHLRKSTGHFVVTGSVAGRKTLKGSIYGASKWFVNGFGQNLADEMAQWGGRCTTISPGMVNTAFFDSPKPDKLAPENVADAVLFALNAPQRSNVREVFLMPSF